MYDLLQLTDANLSSGIPATKSGIKYKKNVTKQVKN